MLYRISVCGNVSPLVLHESSRREQFTQEVMVCTFTVIEKYGHSNKLYYIFYAGSSEEVREVLISTPNRYTSVIMFCISSQYTAVAV